MRVPLQKCFQICVSLGFCLRGFKHAHTSYPGLSSLAWVQPLYRMLVRKSLKAKLGHKLHLYAIVFVLDLRMKSQHYTERDCCNGCVFPYQQEKLNSDPSVACVVGARRGERGAETSERGEETSIRSVRGSHALRARSFPPLLPLCTPATQANPSVLIQPLHPTPAFFVVVFLCFT